MVEERKEKMTYHWKTEVAILENRIHILEQRGDNAPILAKLKRRLRKLLSSTY